VQPFEVPLSAAPQSFTIPLNGIDYAMRVSWCKPSQCWLLDISSSDGTPLALGIPLVTGDDLLAQYEYLGIGGALVVQTDSDLDVVPDFDSLGTVGHLYFVIE
jgi:hypothetical protein